MVELTIKIFDCFEVDDFVIKFFVVYKAELDDQNIIKLILNYFA